MMPRFIRKKGEKSALLSKCGELLFGCTGELLTTQGIYVPKSLSSRLAPFICKRTVWVPDSLSHECLVHCLESFGATLPFSVPKVASLHRFGVCGINPTRTLRADEKSFLLLARIPHKQFAVYGIVEIGTMYVNNHTFIERITTNKDDLLDCVDWMKSESALYQQSKQPENKRMSDSVSTDKTKDQESETFERTSESQEIMKEAEQNPIQPKSTETESEASVNTDRKSVV